MRVRKVEVTHVEIVLEAFLSYDSSVFKHLNTDHLTSQSIDSLPPYTKVPTAQFPHKFEMLESEFLPCVFYHYFFNRLEV